MYPEIFRRKWRWTRTLELNENYLTGECATSNTRAICSLYQNLSFYIKAKDLNGYPGALHDQLKQDISQMIMLYYKGTLSWVSYLFAFTGRS